MIATTNREFMDMLAHRLGRAPGLEPEPVAEEMEKALEVAEDIVMRQNHPGEDVTPTPAGEDS